MQDWRLTAILSNSVSQLKFSSIFVLYSFPRNTIFILSCSEYDGRKGLAIEFVTLPFFSVLCQATLPRKILLCPINLGTQWTMEISSNE